MTLPPPTPEMRLHQQALLDVLHQTLDSHQGRIPFDEFMKIALYYPGLGYYSAGMSKFGPSGDFVTAPEISPLFSQCLGAQCAQILKAFNPSTRAILELGAGSGKMAKDLMHFLHQKNLIPAHYYIVEVSADLKSRQQAYLKQHCAHFFEKFVWLDTLPSTSFDGIILANEVIDALPISLFQISPQNEVLEGLVSYQDNVWQIQYSTPVSPALYFSVEALSERIGKFEPGFTSEIQLNLLPWIKSLSTCLNQGIMLFIDYGFPSQEYYHPQRNQGTLMCHYRHHAHPDPLLYIGLQDITAHVDFTQLALSAHACDLKLAGFTTQAAFLIGNGLLELAQITADDPQSSYRCSQQIQYLTAPHEMGELFKVMAFEKNFDLSLQGFSLLNHTHRL